MENLKEMILSRVETHDNVSFAEIEGYPGFRGDLSMEIGDMNIFLWTNMSSEAILAITELEREGLIVFSPTSLWTYLADGVVNSAPVAKTDKKYKKPHWLPIVLCRPSVGKSKGEQ